jgi:DNA-binding NarL/FixJ family response regulator
VHVTEREVAILQHMAQGYRTKRSAHNYSISEHTVKTHCIQHFRKLEARDRGEAVAKSLQKD